MHYDQAFDDRFFYGGSDLGAVYSREQTTLRLWAPTAKAVELRLFTAGDPRVMPEPAERVQMQRGESGTWTAALPGDRSGTYYTYFLEFSDHTAEACDPYARAVGVNGLRAMILDEEATAPEGWSTDRDPHFGRPITDAVLYEAHIRDLTADESAGIRNPGKFLGLCETDSHTPGGEPTALAHMKALGITHVQFLPIFDFGSVDEAAGKSAYNWGYDPMNFNVPEGSYSTNPFDGAVRVAECKKMIRCLHENGISVVMDVVYNHVYDRDRFCFNRIVPGYFSRPGANGSGCGNDTASERAMVRKYIVDSVCYWADAYHIDGFRFDLLGLLDVQTVNAVVAAVREKHPNVIFYAEGWTMDTRLTRKDLPLATQQNAALTPEVAYFSDQMRDLIKGSIFDRKPGFVAGRPGLEEAAADAFRARSVWTVNPAQTVNFDSCHDNHTLFDRLTLSTPGASRAERISMQRLAAAMVLLSQGVPMLHAGEELLRSKVSAEGTFVENSYNSPDAVNAIRYLPLDGEEGRVLRDYYRGLIALRRAHPSLHLEQARQVEQAVKVLCCAEQLAAFRIREAGGDLIVVFNARRVPARISLPAGRWRIFAQGSRAGLTSLGTAAGIAVAEPISALVLGM